MIVAWARSLTLFACRIAGRIAEALSKPVPFHVLMLIGIAELLWLADSVRHEWLGATANWLTLQNVLAVWAFGFVIAMIRRARRRLFVTRFEDFSEKKAGLEAAGFGVLVTAQLSSLTDLFREQDKGRALQSTPDPLRPLNATFEAEGGVPGLESAVSSEASFALGGFQIPVGFVLGLLSPIVRGPRLTGQIHRDGRTRVVTLRLAGALGERTWRVVDESLGGEPGQEVWRSATELADEIACRIFAEMAIGAVDWAALAHYVAGIRAYRKALSRAEDQQLNLRSAERHLIEATAKDPQFDRAYYNLGVVYTEIKRSSRLEQLEASASAFELALQKNPGRWSTHYALATINFERSQALRVPAPARAVQYLSATLDHCHQALRFAPDAGAVSDVLNVMTLVLWSRGWQQDQAVVSVREFSKASRKARRGLRSAWASLCAAELGLGFDLGELPAVRERARARTVRSLSVIAVMDVHVIDRADTAGVKGRWWRWIRRALIRDAIRCLRQARRFAPMDSGLVVHLGNTYRIAARWRKAADALRFAARLQPDYAETWALLTLALVHLDQHFSAAETMKRVFENAGLMTELAVKVIAEAKEVHRLFVSEIGAFAQQKASRKSIGLLRGTPRALWLAYRLGERRFIAFASASTTFFQLLNDPAERQASIDRFEMNERRANALSVFHAGVEDKKNRQAAGELKKLCAAKRAADHAWEYAHAVHALVIVYRDQGRWDLAAKWLRRGIAWLEPRLDREIRRRGLDAMLSYALRQQGKTKEAFEAANRGVARDPLSAFERNELGWVYFDSSDFAMAQQVWSETLLIAPNDPDLHIRLGQVHLRRIDEKKDPASRREMQAIAQRHLETALDLLDRSDPARNDARFFFADAQSSVARYGDAIRELLALERADYYNTIVRLLLADAYLANEDWVQADTLFRQLAAEFDGQLCHEHADTLLSSPAGSKYFLGTSAAFAHLGIASALGNRDIKLTEALAEVKKARAALATISDAAVKAQWLAKCDFYDGWLLLKQDQLDPAVQHLEAALAIEVTSDANLALAEALLRRIELRGNGQQVDASMVRRAHSYCTEAQRLDWPGVLAKRTARIDARLSALAAQ